MSKRNIAVVRMLRRAVNMTYVPVQDDMSAIKPDRSEQYARKLLKKVDELSRADPNNKFGTYLTRLISLLAKQLRNRGH